MSALTFAGCVGRPHAVASVQAASRDVSKQSTGDYPYVLQLGQSVYRVERESDEIRPSIDFESWTSWYGAEDAHFRARNPGAKAILIWNVRKQVSRIQRSQTNWETTEWDYPGRGWERSVVPAGGSAEFPMYSLTTNSWRVCLLYSREIGSPEAEKRLFDGNYEVIGPSVQEKLTD